ncbi:MAG: GTPase-associated system all-helical protein GASH [Pedobacter sp.]|uniref:GTPase-associated system all-helical protein GASH n=1 Tax=Pedobacter sp. TaxID=1411316 RepID=UPI003569BCA5
MLREFVNEGVLILADDSHFDKLKKTSGELVKKLKNKNKILSYTMTALDSQVSIENPEIIEVKELITKNWTTFLSNVKDTPLAYIRAVMLDALSDLAKDIINATIIWNAGRDAIKYKVLVDKEKNILRKFLLELGERVEQEAILRWSFKDIELSEAYAKNQTYLPIDKAKIEAHLKAAAGTADYDGENPVSTASTDSWHNFFSKRAGTGIADEVTAALKFLANKSTAKDNAIVEYVTSLQAQLKNQALKSELLWWKESGYSSTVKKGYEQIEECPLQILLASDFANLLPEICPASADFFLIRTMKTICADREVTFGEFLDEITSSSNLCQQFLVQSSGEENTSTLLGFVRGLLWGQLKKEEFKKIVGPDLDTKVKLSYICNWLFHGYQISKLIAIK